MPSEPGGLPVGVAGPPQKRRCSESAGSLYACLLVTFLAGVNLPQAHAQERKEPGVLDALGNFKDFDDVELEDLLNFTVTIAAGKAQTLEEAPSIVSVISDRQLRDGGWHTVEEALEQVPGIWVMRDSLGRDRIGIRGSFTSGGLTSSSEGVLILFNGRRLNSPLSGGATDFNLDFPVDNVKKIEIVRGPGSAVFGENAFLGVINIVTYNSDTLHGVEVSLGGGSFNTQQYNISFGQSVGNVGLTGFFQFRDTNGARLAVPADTQSLLDAQLAPFGLPPASFAPGFTEDDRRSFDANLTLEVDAFVLNARVKDDDSGGFIGPLDNLTERGNRLNNNQIVLDASYNWQIGERDLRLRGGYNRGAFSQDLSIFPNGFTAFLPNGSPLVFPQGVIVDQGTKTWRSDAELRLDQPLFRGNTLTTGISFANDSVFGQRTTLNIDPVFRFPLPQLVPGPPLVADVDRRLFSLFAQDTWNPVPALGITAGLRYDRYNDFGDTVNPRAAVVWRLPRDLSLKLLYGRAFRAPSFLELFTTIPAFSGNPDLKPVTINTVELALGYKRRNVRVSGNAYANYLRNSIVLDPPDVTGTASFTNIEGIDAKGFELEYEQTVGRDHSLRLAYAYQHSKDVETGEQSARVPRHLGSVGGTVRLGDFLKLTPTVLFRGSVPREPMDPREDVENYAVVNLNFMTKELGDHFTLNFTIFNLFDKEYFDPSPLGGVPFDYPRPGRNVFLKGTWRF